MRDTIWAGKLQKLVFDDGVPKGAEQILIECGFQNTEQLVLDMIAILENHTDFRDEKNALATLIENRGHKALFLPKFN